MKLVEEYVRLCLAEVGAEGVKGKLTSALRGLGWLVAPGLAYADSRLRRDKSSGRTQKPSKPRAVVPAPVPAPVKTPASERELTKQSLEVLGRKLDRGDEFSPYDSSRIKPVVEAGLGVFEKVRSEAEARHQIFTQFSRSRYPEFYDALKKIGVKTLA